MQLAFLADHPDLAPILGRWYFEQWGHLLDGDTEEDVVRRVNGYLNRDRLPFIVVALEGERLAGAAQLRRHEMKARFPEREHWLGGVYVAEDFRGRGLASRLAEDIASRAPAYDVHLLHLQTERLDGGLYTRLGWAPCLEVRSRGCQVLVMERHLGG